MNDNAWLSQLDTLVQLEIFYMCVGLGVIGPSQYLAILVLEPLLMPYYSD